MIFVVIPLVGYVGLWLMGTLLFLAYFRVFRVVLDVKHAVHMIQGLPPALAIVTVPLCSFVSFFTVTKVTLHALAASAGMVTVIQVAAVSLAVTVVLDLLVTVLGERIDIRVFPVNLMYLFAWALIVPAVILAGS